MTLPVAPKQALNTRLPCLQAATGRLTLPILGHV
jgi:hypothetical protein